MRNDEWQNSLIQYNFDGSLKASIYRSRLESVLQSFTNESIAL